MSPSAPQKSSNMSFLTGVNAEYIAHLYVEFKRDPMGVSQSWRDFFMNLNDEELDVLREMHGASWTPAGNRAEGRGFGPQGTPAQGNVTMMPQPVQYYPAPYAGPQGPNAADQAAQDSIRALQLIRAYRSRGHLSANQDPLGMRKAEDQPELDPAHHGFGPGDYDRPIRLDGVLGLQSASLNEILRVLKATYCGSIGVEYMQVTDPQERSWIQERAEQNNNRANFSAAEKRALLSRLMAAEYFEGYLHKKFPGTKRFGVDGGEAMIPAIEEIISRAANMGLREAVLGMAHRGRLNVLANVMGKPYRAIFAEFQGMDSHPQDVQGSGDVKYHLGASSDRDFNGQSVHLSLTPNPSHLEAVNPVVIGKVRAKQVQKQDTTALKVMPILIHGDAAFAGQGLVAETLMIAELPGYRVGGTMHFVINNQIGFTTMPQYSRSGPYCTDVAKMLSSPIFHVNGDDPEAVIHVARMAAEFRQTFKKDIVIDMVCYRRYGHNEGDEPAFTQPLMYKKIATHETVAVLYGRKLENEGVIKPGEFEQMKADVDAMFEKAFAESVDYKPTADIFAGEWSGLTFPNQNDSARRGKTGISDNLLKELGRVLTTVPEGFNLNPKLERLLKAKAQMFETGEGFDWATGEALAYGSLVHEGFSVRLSGQDCGRGTFSHRHAIVYDQVTEDKYVALQNISDKQGRFEVHDSPLSEAAVLGFEYGYSITEPKSLVLWEAQFGDFANGAQVLIDQFICSAESKWLRMSGLTLLLPHGYEGQGPEHSSARWERFLQLSAEDNWQVVNCTTPANYFHALRRQLHRDFRKPLIIMTPKSLLRHKLCVSKATDMTGTSTFHRVLHDDADMAGNLAKPKDIKRVILCSGKVYYDLYQAREDKKINDVLILRVEQVYPFPHEALLAELNKYPNADVVWCQEEPENMGCWFFVDRRIEAVLRDAKHKAGRPSYVGRPAAASPATGNLKRHAAQQQALLDEALILPRKK